MDEHELVIIDRTFSDMSKEDGVQKAFRHYLYNYNDMLEYGRMPIVGDDKLFSYFSKIDESEIELVWEPLSADTTSTGDIGFTFGEYQLKTDEAVSKGNYVTVWKKNESSEWKVVLDTSIIPPSLFSE